MKNSWIPILLLAASCAAPKSTYVPEFRISPTPSDPGAFAVTDFSGEPETRRYRIKPEELLASSSTAVFDGRPSDGRLILPPPDSIEDLASRVLAEAALVIRTLVAPETWSSDPRCALYVEKDDLVVRHAPKALAQIERLMETLKANRQTMLRLRVRFLSIPLEEMAAIRHLPPMREGLGGVLDRAELEKFVPKGPRPGGMIVSGVPYLALHHGQAGQVTVGNSFPYIKACKISETGYDPVIDVIPTGLELRVRAVADGPESDRFLLDAAADVVELNGVTALNLGDYVIQVPSTTKSRAAGRFVVGPDQAAVFLVPQVRFGPGIWGSLGSPGPAPSRRTLAVLELDRAE